MIKIDLNKVVMLAVSKRMACKKGGSNSLINLSIMNRIKQVEK